MESLNNAHPRLFFDRESVKRIDKYGEYAKKLRENAKKLAEKPLFSEEYANSEPTQHGKFFDLGAQLEQFSETFGILYLLGEKEYFPKMRDALLHYAKFEVWAGPANKFRKVPWHSELSTTRILYGFAFAYDCMYDGFTDEERKTIREAMIRLGIRPLLSDWVLPGERIHALDSMGHNWWAVCIALAGVGILSILDEEPWTEDWLRMTDEALHGFCEYGGATLLNKVSNFDGRGMFYESAGYFNYGTGELCRYLLARKNCLGKGTEDFPVLEKVPDAFMALSYPVADSRKFLFVNFGDSSLTSAGYELLPRRLLALGIGDENFRRFYRDLKKADTWLDLMFPEAYETDGEPVVLPSPDVYPDTGLAFFRDGDTELAVRCGFTWNHAHDDGGSFLYFANGEDILCDSGSVPYNKKDYVGHYCSAEAHSVIKVGGKGQFEENIYRGSRFTGRVELLTDSCLLADVTGPTADRCLRNFRTFVVLEKGLFAVVDEIYTYAPTTFEWLLHYRGTMTGENGVCTVKTEKNFLRFFSVTEAPSETEIRTHDGVSYFADSQKEPSRYFNRITVFSLGEEEVTAAKKEWANSYGCEIMKNGKRYFIAYNYEADGRRMHVNSINTMNGYETDAYLLAGKEGEVTVIYGSYLRKEGKSLFESFTKESVSVKEDLS